MKYGVWLAEWLKYYVQISAKHRTIVRYSEIVYRNICPKLGECELCDLTAIGLQRFVSELLLCGNYITRKGLSASAVNSIITVLQNSLSAACGSGLIQNNPAKSIKRPKTAEQQIESFSVAEQKKIEHVVITDERKYMLGVVLCLYTGIRLGELLALEWQDIDFANAVLSVTKTCYDGKDANGTFGRIIDRPKTDASRRMIPIPRQLMPFLKEAKRSNDSEFVISKNGAPVLVRTYQRNFASLLKKLNIGHKDFHALRHTFATRATECGMDVKTLSEILGHKNATVTLNRYVHSLLGHKRDMMNKLGKLL